MQTYWKQGGGGLQSRGKNSLCLLAMNFTLWKKSHVQNNVIKIENKLLHDKKKTKQMHWQRFLSNLHHCVKQDTELQSEPAEFPDITENKKRPRGEMGNATQQLGANWRGIHYSLLPGKLVFFGKEMLLSDWWGQRLCIQWLEEVKLWSHKGLHRSHGTANKGMNFWVA